MNRVVHTSPSGTLTAFHADGSVAGEYEYADLKIEVEDTIEGGDEPIEIEVRKDAGDGILLLDVDEMRGRVLDPDDPERRRYPRGEVAFKPGGQILARLLPDGAFEPIGTVRAASGGRSFVREAHARDQPMSRAERRRLERETRRSK